MRSSADLAAGAAQDREHETDDYQHEANRPQDGDIGDQTDYKKDQAEDNHQAHSFRERLNTAGGTGNAWS